jgi:hypothetical protein
VLDPPPAPLPGESATGGSPSGELTTVDRPPGAVAASVPPGPGGVPGVLFAAYRQAERVLAASAPRCQLGWPMLAAIGRAASGHAGGGQVDAHGRTLGRLLGPRLDGSAGLPRIPDSDGGALDDDRVWDRAVGPMQIVPSVWRRYGADGDGDGQRDPNDIFDAALTAGRYLCAGNVDLAVPAQQTTALYRFSHSDSYVSAVRAFFAEYARGTRAEPHVVPGPAARPRVRSAAKPGHVVAAGKRQSGRANAPKPDTPKPDTPKSLAPHRTADRGPPSTRRALPPERLAAGQRTEEPTSAPTTPPAAQGGYQVPIIILPPTQSLGPNSVGSNSPSPYSPYSAGSAPSG